MQLKLLVACIETTVLAIFLIFLYAAGVKIATIYRQEKRQILEMVIDLRLCTPLGLKAMEIFARTYNNGGMGS